MKITNQIKFGTLTTTVSLEAPTLNSVRKLPNGSVELQWTHAEDPANFNETEVYAKRVGIDENWTRIGIRGNTDTACEISDPSAAGNGDLETPWQAGQDYVVAVQAYDGTGIAKGVDSLVSNELPFTY